MFGGGERYNFSVPAVVQVEIVGTGTMVVDEAEQVAGGAIAEKIPEVEEVTAGAVADAKNEVDEVATGAVANAANEVDEVATGAGTVTDETNEVEEVAADGVVEVVANGHIDVEEEEIDLNNIPIYIETEHTAKFDFMAYHYARSPVATNADPAVAKGVPRVAEGGNMAEEVLEVVAEAAEGGAVELIDPVHVPVEVVAGEGEGAVTFVTEEDIAEPIIIPTQAVVADEAEEVVAADKINPVHVPTDVVANEAEDLN